MSRDLIGYGGAWPDLTWPNRARLAVSEVVNVGEGAEQQTLDGDPASERIGEVLSVVPEDRPDPGQAQILGIIPLTETAECTVFAAIRKGGFPADLHQDLGQWPRERSPRGREDMTRRPELAHLHGEWRLRLQPPLTRDFSRRLQCTAFQSTA